jgi:hypothetical protein
VRISATASALYEGDIEAAVDRSAFSPRAAALDPRAKPRPCLRRPTPLGEEFASAAVSAWFATARAGADSATSCWSCVSSVAQSRNVLRKPCRVTPLFTRCSWRNRDDLVDGGQRTSARCRILGCHQHLRREGTVSATRASRVAENLARIQERGAARL